MQTVTFPETPSKQALTPGKDPRESARRSIAYVLLFYLGLTLVAALILIFVTAIPEARAQTILAVVFGPTVGLVGTVVGFYFGAQTALETPNQPGI